MFMAGLCYIFIYIIKWFLKSPACFRIHMKYENNFNWSMHTRGVTRHLSHETRQDTRLCKREQERDEIFRLLNKILNDE